MADEAFDRTDIHTVYEPGWGETGKQESKDLVMIEKPIGIYRINIESYKENRELLKEEGLEGTPENIILIAEKDEESKSTRMIFNALNRANAILVTTKDKFPRTKQEGIGLVSPVNLLYHVTEPYAVTSEENESSKVDAQKIILYKVSGSTHENYVTARNMLVEEANKILKEFNTNLEIPYFPKNEEELEAI